MAKSELFDASRTYNLPPPIFGVLEKTMRNCWSGLRPPALFVGRNAPVIVESTVSVALLLGTKATLLLTTTENTAPLSEPCALAME